METGLSFLKGCLTWLGFFFLFGGFLFSILPGGSPGMQEMAPFYIFFGIPMLIIALLISFFLPSKKPLPNTLQNISTNKETNMNVDKTSNFQKANLVYCRIMGPTYLGGFYTNAYVAELHRIIEEAEAKEFDSKRRNGRAFNWENVDRARIEVINKEINNDDPLVKRYLIFIYHSRYFLNKRYLGKTPASSIVQFYKKFLNDPDFLVRMSALVELDIPKESFRDNYKLEDYQNEFGPIYFNNLYKVLEEYPNFIYVGGYDCVSDNDFTGVPYPNPITGKSNLGHQSLYMLILERLNFLEWNFDFSDLKTQELMRLIELRFESDPNCVLAELLAKANNQSGINFLLDKFKNIHDQSHISTITQMIKKLYISTDISPMIKNIIFQNRYIRCTYSIGGSEECNWTDATNYDLSLGDMLKIA